MAGAFHYLDPRGGYVNDPAWMVFDSLHLKHYGFLGVEPDGPPPVWFNQSADLAELGEKTGIDPDGLAATLERWNDIVAHEVDPDFGRVRAPTTATGATPRRRRRRERRWAPSTPRRSTPCRSRSARWAPRWPAHRPDGRVLHVGGEPIPRAVRRGQRDGGRDRASLRRRRRDHRPGDGVRLPGRAPGRDR